MSSEPAPPSPRPPESDPPARRVRRVELAAVLTVLAVLVVLTLGWWWRRHHPHPPVAGAGPAAQLPMAPVRSAEPGSVRSAEPGPARSIEPAAASGAAEPESEHEPATLEAQKAALLERMQRVLGLDAATVAKLRAIFERSRALSQGNPEITRHPMTRAECLARRKAAGPLPAGDARCKAPNMVPIYDAATGADRSADRASTCIDQYEFPNVACDYPVVWVKADEAVELCRAVGKRICDAHEWEGACAGAVKPPESEYAFGQRRMMIEYLHNQAREIVWAYGKTKDHSKCATGSRKSPKCHAGGWTLCGSNTYPAGAFPECRSSFGVFDQHGNAAEHMNLPLAPAELASRGGLGETEMKGSWFIFAKGEAHIDDCRWRAPMWHHTKIADPNSHRNYHLGFRCCKDL